MDYIAVLGCEFKVYAYQGVTEVGEVTVPTPLVFMLPPSTNTFIDNKGVYTADNTITIPSGSTVNGFNLINPIILTFSGTNTNYNTIDNAKVLLENEESDEQQGSWINSSEVTQTYTLKAVITSANQEVVTAE